MGSSQSTRKISVDNEEPVSVIRVSENVAKRLKTTNEADKPNATSTTTVIPQPEVPASNPIMNQNPYEGVYIPQPYMTSTMVRQQIEKELEKNDQYWELRVKGLQENQNKITRILELEFHKAYNEVESTFPSKIAPGSSNVPCEDFKSRIVDCFKNNANHTLNCSTVVKEFTTCISNCRPTQHKTRSV